MADYLFKVDYLFKSEPNPPLERMGEFGYVYPHGVSNSTRKDFTIIVCGLLFHTSWTV